MNKKGTVSGHFETAYKGRAIAESRVIAEGECALAVPIDALWQCSRARAGQNRTALCRIIPIMLNRIAKVVDFCTIDRDFAKKKRPMPAEQPAALVAALSPYRSVLACD